MSYGRITSIVTDPTGSKTGELVDIDTGTMYKFVAEKNIPNANGQDIVDFTFDPRMGTAVNLVHNIALKVTGFAGANPDVQKAIQTLVQLQAKDVNDTDIVSRKVK